MQRRGRSPKAGAWIAAPAWVSVIIVVSAAILATVRVATLQSSPAHAPSTAIGHLEAEIKALDEEAAAEKYRLEVARAAARAAVESATAEAKRFQEAQREAKAEVGKRLHIQAELDDVESELRSAQRNASKFEEKYKEEEMRLNESGSQRYQRAEARAEAEATKRHQVEVQMAQAALKLRAAQASAAAQAGRLRQLEAELREARKHTGGGGGSGRLPVDRWFREIHSQNALAFISGLVGVWSIVGPSAFLRCFFPVVGSLLGGLMAASCVNYAGVGHECFLDSVGSLLGGSGHRAEYLLWLCLLSLGVLRWLLSWDCALYAVIDEVDLSLPPAAEGSLRKPLLSLGDGGGPTPSPPQGRRNPASPPQGQAGAPSTPEDNGQRRQPSPGSNSNHLSVPQPVTPTLSEVLRAEDANQAVQHDVV